MIYMYIPIKDIGLLKKQERDLEYIIELLSQSNQKDGDTNLSTIPIRGVN